jgi:AcrR family transcriptional regulator
MLREDAILDAAQELMAVKGYGSMTMDDVASLAGIAKATLYQHVRSKEELSVQVVLRSLGRIVAYVTDLDPALPTLERFRRVLVWTIRQRFGEQGVDFRDAEGAVMPLLKRHPTFQELERHLVDGIARIVDEAKGEGSIPPTLSTLVVAHAFVGCMRNASYEDLLANGRCTMEELTETLLFLFTSGLRTDAGREPPNAG